MNIDGTNTLACLCYINKKTETTNINPLPHMYVIKVGSSHSDIHTLQYVILHCIYIFDDMYVYYYTLLYIL